MLPWNLLHPASRGIILSATCREAHAVHQPFDETFMALPLFAEDEEHLRTALMLFRGVHEGLAELLLLRAAVAHLGDEAAEVGLHRSGPQAGRAQQLRRCSGNRRTRPSEDIENWNHNPVLHFTFAEIVSRRFPIIALEQNVGDGAGDQDIAGIAAIHHPLGKVDSAARDVAVRVNVGDAVHWSRYGFPCAG